MEKVFVSDPDILDGTPVFPGTRVAVQNLLDYFEGNESLDAFLNDFPTVTKEQAILFLRGHKVSARGPHHFSRSGPGTAALKGLRLGKPRVSEPCKDWA